MDLTATYSPEDNKLRLYTVTRLDAETYAKVKAYGFSWAPRQQLFVAPMWTPQREDLLLKLCGEIGDEDKSLVQRATERAERFENYSENRAKDAEQARKQVDSIVAHIPFGQPILVGHHSEKRARRDVERVDNGMRKSIKMWDTSQYWTARAEAAIGDAKYKERPDVRARRIRRLEAEERKQDRILKHARKSLSAWSAEGLTHEQALIVAESSDCYLPRKEGDRPDFNQSPHASTALKGDFPSLYAPRELEEIVASAKICYTRSIAHHERWQAHFANRLTYERTMLKVDGGIKTDQIRPEIGGACQCWASPRGGWSIIQKVNKVSVTLLDNWGNGGRDFRRTIPFDKLRSVMSKAEVDEARQDGRLLGEKPIGFVLTPKGTGESLQPEHPKVADAPAVHDGIETPRGPLIRKAPAQQVLFNLLAQQSPRQGNGAVKTPPHMAHLRFGSARWPAAQTPTANLLTCQDEYLPVPPIPSVLACPHGLAPSGTIRRLHSCRSCASHLATPVSNGVFDFSHALLDLSTGVLGNGFRDSSKHLARLAGISSLAVVFPFRTTDRIALSLGKVRSGSLSLSSRCSSACQARFRGRSLKAR